MKRKSHILLGPEKEGTFSNFQVQLRDAVLTNSKKKKRVRSQDVFFRLNSETSRTRAVFSLKEGGQSESWRGKGGEVRLPTQERAAFAIDFQARSHILEAWFKGVEGKRD